MQYNWYTDIRSAIYNFFKIFKDMFYPTLPFGPIAYAVMFYTIPFLVIIIILARRAKRGSALPDGVKRIIASTGDVSAGIAGVKRIPFVRIPQDALVFLKIEENAIQQAITAIDYYVQQGEIDESFKEKLVDLYQDRLRAVQAAISSSAELREVIDSSTAVDKARSDYLRKLAAMSGTAVESDSSVAGPSSVGMPDLAPAEVAKTPTSRPSGGAPSGGAPSGGPPSGGPPSGGAPSGGPPGGILSSGAPSGGPPGGVPSGSVPSGAVPGGGPPGEAPVGTSSGPPGGIPSSAGPPGGAAGAPSTGGKSTLQSEMLAEMERLRALMSGD